MPRKPRRAASTAPRAYWTGHLKLSLLSFPVRVYNVVSSTGRISMHQLDRKSGERIHYKKVANDREVPAEDIVKGYEYAKGRYVTLDQNELDNIALETARTMDIVQFVPKDELDPVFRDQSYYLAPEGDVADSAFRVIRDALAESDKVAIVRVVFASRERIAALEPHAKGCLLTTLHYANEVKAADPFFQDIGDGTLPKDELTLARQLIDARTAAFDPDKYADRYQDALRALVDAKIAGEEPAQAPKPSAKIVNLMDALKKSVAESKRPEQKRPEQERPEQKRPAPKPAGAKKGRKSA